MKSLAEAQAAMAEEVAARKQWAERVRALRRRMRLSQERFAEVVGVASGTVMLWENAINGGAIDTVAIIAALERAQDLAA